MSGYTYAGDVVYTIDVVFSREHPGTPSGTHRVHVAARDTFSGRALAKSTAAQMVLTITKGPHVHVLSTEIVAVEL